jgi:hypothetical protein
MDLTLRSRGVDCPRVTHDVRREKPPCDYDAIQELWLYFSADWHCYLREKPPCDDDAIQESLLYFPVFLGI